jgi:hypothetical protein
VRVLRQPAPIKGVSYRATPRVWSIDTTGIKAT